MTAKVIQRMDDLDYDVLRAVLLQVLSKTTYKTYWALGSVDTLSDYHETHETTHGNPLQLLQTSKHRISKASKTLRIWTLIALPLAPPLPLSLLRR